MARGDYRHDKSASGNQPALDKQNRIIDLNKHFKPQFDKNGKERDDWFYLYCKEHDFAIASVPLFGNYGKEAVHDASTGNRKKGGLR